MNLTKKLELEFFKLKHRGFWITWLVLTLVPLAYEIHSLTNINYSDTMLFESETVKYLFILTQEIEILSLVLPVMASILISRLSDLEFKGNTWKLLTTSNFSVKELWDVKFLIVFILMELTSFLVYVILILGLTFGLGYTTPSLEIVKSFFGLTGANFIVLTIAQFLAFNFKNQIIVLIEGLAGGLIGIMSSLMPRMIVYFLPWGYYTLNMLAGAELLYRNSEGINVWYYYPIEPNYIVITLVTIFFIVLNIVLRNYISRKEL